MQVECIATDGVHLASVCLGGQLKIWDNNTGESVAVIDRKAHFGLNNNEAPKGFEQPDDPSDSESSWPSMEAAFSPNMGRINTSFSSVRLRCLKGEPDWMRDMSKILFTPYHRSNSGDKSGGSSRKTSDSSGGKLSSVWAMDYVDNLVIIGCADGRLELWEATTCKLKVSGNFLNARLKNQRK